MEKDECAADGEQRVIGMPAEIEEEYAEAGADDVEMIVDLRQRIDVATVEKGERVTWGEGK